MAFAAAVIADCLGVIAQQLVARIAFIVGKQLFHLPIIMLEITLQHRFTKGFFRTEVVVERAFRHPGRIQQFTQPHAGKTKAQA
ncbi:hypothetical protein D3C76_1592780 [compost metagenome]